MNETIVYIDRSDVHEGKLDELKLSIRYLAEVAERLEPRLISYGFHVDEAAHRMTVVAVHPDSASLELHMETLAAEFRKLGPLLTLRSIEVFGRVSDKAIGLLQNKAVDLGEAGVVVCERTAGFSRRR